MAFSADSNGTDTPLGYGAQSSSGTWTFTFSTAGCASGKYTLFAVAEHRYGEFADSPALTLQLL